MKRLGILALLVAIGFSVSLDRGEAAWTKRGWYLEKPEQNCVMRKVSSTDANGNVVVETVRVCR